MTSISIISHSNEWLNIASGNFVDFNTETHLVSLNVTTSGRNCNTIFDVLTSKMPNADQSKHAFVCVGFCFSKIGTSK